MKVIFLDIDGVLNDHERRPNGYCGTTSYCVDTLNLLLEEVPDSRIVVSSAWRYAVLNGWMTLEGFEFLLLTHGVHCKGRLHGVTAADPEHFKATDHEAPFDAKYWRERGLRWRCAQILAYVQDYQPESWVVLDDLPLEVPNLVRTAADTPDDKDGLRFHHFRLARKVLLEVAR